MAHGQREASEGEDAEGALPFSEDDLSLMKSFKIRMD